MKSTESKFEVNTLCGSKDIEMAKKSILTLQRLSTVCLHHKIFSDGSICKSQKEFESSGISCTVISREEADDLVEPEIVKYKHIQQYRKSNVLLRKAIDAPILSENKIINLADTDVFALKPFRNLFEVERDLAFNREHRIGSSGKFIDILRMHNKFPLAFQLNSGIYQISKEIHDLDYIDYVIRDSSYFPGSGFLHEQTIWSCLAGRNISKLEFFNVQSVSVVIDSTNLKSDILAVGHFIRPYRHRLAEVDFTHQRQGKNILIEISTHKGDKVNPRKLMADRILYKASRLLTKS